MMALMIGSFWIPTSTQWMMVGVLVVTRIGEWLFKHYKTEWEKL